MNQTSCRCMLFVSSLKQGIEYQQAIRLFGRLKPGARALSNSDEFHIAHAQHMIDWLLSERCLTFDDQIIGAAPAELACIP
jgi:hypothetical protein